MLTSIHLHKQKMGRSPSLHLARKNCASLAKPEPERNGIAAPRTLIGSHLVAGECSARNRFPTSRRNENAPSLRDGAFQHGCLTMSYFRTGVCTIIGAEAFHGPVRDGKGWFHLAMVIRRLPWLVPTSPFQGRAEEHNPEDTGFEAPICSNRCRPSEL